MNQKEKAFSFPKPSVVDCLNIDEEFLQKLYRHARKLLIDGRFTEASNSFFFLTVIAPDIQSFWLGFVFSLIETANFSYALNAANIAIRLDKKNIDAYFALVRIHIEMEEFEAAQSVLDTAIEFAKKEADEAWRASFLRNIDIAKKELACFFQREVREAIST